MTEQATIGRKTYDESVVVDALNVSNWDSSAVYESLGASGVSAINATIATWEGFTETLDAVAAWPDRFRRHADVVTPVRSVDDILQAKRDGKVGVVLGFQNASPIENRLDRLAIFHALGVRVIQVTYHERNLLGNGCYEPKDFGLSSFGVDAIREMNRLGILIDLSHVGDKTTLDSIEASEKPVAVTHANARSFCDRKRNKADDALKALAEKGGVVGSTCIVSFLPEWTDATVESYVNAIDYLVEMIGVDHVGIGTDYTQDQPTEFWKYISSQEGTKFPAKWALPDTERFHEMTLYPKGLETPDKLPVLADALSERGYKPEDIAKVLGGNWMRLFREVWE